MIGFSVETAKRAFFDRAPVTAAVDKGTRTVLSRFGAFVRRRVQSFIRSRKRISNPGSPPSSHTGWLKKYVFFIFVPSTRSVVIGPVRLNQNGGQAPRLLEEGGVGYFKRDKKIVRATYKARPYMGPSLNAELPKLPAMWANSVKAN